MNLLSKVFSFWIKCYIYNNEYILFLKRSIHSNLLCNFLLFFSAPYIVLRWGGLYVYERILGTYLVNRRVMAEKSMQFQHDIALVVISKNEGPYIKEWIEYHKQVGVSKIYFYDNESVDDTFSILTPYIISGFVEYTIIEGKAKQLEAYNDAICHYKNICKYMAFIDMDEFLMPKKPFESISSIVDTLLDKAGHGAVGVAVNWALFGSSHLEKAPQGLVIENFIYRGENNHWANYHIKSICNPRFVKKYISPHYPLYELGAYSISEATSERIYGWFCHSVRYSHLRINHYFCKSKEQYLQKRNRGLADRLGKYELRKFDSYDLNDIRDTSMNFYL